MRDLGLLRRMLVVLAVGVMLFVGCDKQTDSGAGGTQAAPPPVASPDAKTTAATIRQSTPIDCAANAASWNWGTCHDTTKGFDALLACTTTSRD